MHLHAQTFQLLARLGGEIFRKRGQHARTGFDQPHARLPRVDVAELVLECVAGDFGQSAGQFDAGGPAADHCKAQPGGACGRVGFGFCAFEGQQQLAPQHQCVVQRFQARGVFGPLVVAEIGMGGAGGQQQHVVAERAAIGQHHLAAAWCDIGDIAEQYFDIALLAQDVPQRRGDVRCRQAGGGHLIQQGLEQVVVLTVDQSDADAGVVERAGRP